MGCSSGSIENAHLIVVPSCGHWSRAGPPPGGPCLERQSCRLSNQQPFPPDLFRREQALSLQHRLICGVDVIHKPVRSDDLRVPPHALFQERRKQRGCPLRSNVRSGAHRPGGRLSASGIGPHHPEASHPSRVTPIPSGIKRASLLIGAASQR
jgi:hypothetical protein